MTVYYYIGYNEKDKATEKKQKKTLANKVYDYSIKKGYIFHPLVSNKGLEIQLEFEKDKFIIVAEDKESLPKLNKDYTFVTTNNYLKGKVK